MRRRRLRRLLIVVPFLLAAAVGTTYLASNTIAPSYAGVGQVGVSCTTTPSVSCTSP
jgi:hypothetical protein